MFKKRLLQLLKRCVAALLMVVLPAQAFAHNALPKDLGRLDNALVHPALAGDKNALEGNFGLGQSAGQNAVENNYLTTRDLERALDSLKQCTQGCEVIRKSLLRNEQQGGEQQTLGNLQDTCRANPQACASQVQDIGRALTELQKPETLALLGQRNVNALIARQVTDLGQAVEALQWGAANEPTSRLIMQTALVVGTTAVGGGVMLSVGRALMTACAGGPLAPGCVAASTELAVAGMEAAGGVPTVGMTAAGTTAMASRLAKSASSATDVAQVVRQAQLELAAARAGANGGVNPTLLNELATNGVKFTPENVIATARSPSGQVVFLETGSPTAGLRHIVQEHATDFANIGVSEAQIPSVVMRAVTEGNIVGYQGRGTTRPIYEITVNGQPQRIAITTGSNGYIVGANPAGRAP
jgi:hypothetical protein